MSDKRCFLITPLGSPVSEERQHADMVLGVAIKPALESRNYSVHRADQSSDPSMINDYVFQIIGDAELCICDLTFLNPNVFYELGVRHAIELPVIHIAQDGTKIPFDNAGHRVSFFDRHDIHSLGRLVKALQDQIDYIEGADFKVSNPLTQARGRTRLNESSDTADQLLADLTRRLAALEARGSLIGREVAAGIQGQGELATMNIRDLASRLNTFEHGGMSDIEARSSAAVAHSVAAAAQAMAGSSEMKTLELREEFRVLKETVNSNFGTASGTLSQVLSAQSQLAALDNRVTQLEIGRR